MARGGNGGDDDSDSVVDDENKTSTEYLIYFDDKEKGTRFPRLTPWTKKESSRRLEKRGRNIHTVDHESIASNELCVE